MARSERKFSVCLNLWRYQEKNSWINRFVWVFGQLFRPTGNGGFSTNIMFWSMTLSFSCHLASWSLLLGYSSTMTAFNRGMWIIIWMSCLMWVNQLIIRLYPTPFKRFFFLTLIYWRTAPLNSNWKPLPHWWSRGKSIICVSRSLKVYFFYFLFFPPCPLNPQ